MLTERKSPRQEPPSFDRVSDPEVISLFRAAAEVVGAFSDEAAVVMELRL
jgi:hypothetical protein